MSREEDKTETWRILNEPQPPKLQIEKIVIKSKSRKLNATWNVVQTEEPKSEFGADVEEEILRILSDELSRVKK